MFTELKEYKVVMIGNGGVGKTSIVKRLRSCDFQPQYLPTLGVEVNPIRINTNYGVIQFNVWDCAGQECFSGSRDGHYLQANACIGVIEKGSESSVGMLTQELKRDSFQNIPVVTIVNKMEIETNKNEVHMDVFPEAIMVSAKNNQNLHTPFVVLARQLTGLNDLCLL
jgi:GTP-binding nuclear protein Ran